MTDVQDGYERVSQGFDVAVKAVTPGQWGARTPCELWSARDLVGHTVAGHRRVIAGVNGGEATAMGNEEDPTEAWEDAVRVLREIVGNPAALATEMDGPLGTMPVGEIVGRFVTMDLLVHTWDLARAVGADERLDEGAVAQVYEAMKPMDEMIRQPGIFGPKLDPPPGADLQTEFLYFLGRRA